MTKVVEVKNVQAALDQSEGEPVRRNASPFPPVGEQKKLEPGLKFDLDKLPIDLVSPYFIEAIAAVLDFGAKKYGARNWEKGMSWSRVYGALLRHMLAWQRGENDDPETGLSHLWHAGCCIMFLVHFEKTGTGTDDRP